MAIDDILGRLEKLLDELPPPAPEDKERRRLAAIVRTEQREERDRLWSEHCAELNGEEGPEEGEIRCAALHVKEGENPGDHLLTFSFVTCPVTQEFCEGPEECVLRVRGNFKPEQNGEEEN